MSKDRIKLGNKGEELALKVLRKMGYKPLVSNFRCSLGEIDLVAKDGETLVFIEIKTRRHRSLGYAKEAVHRRKQRQISRAALVYMKQNRCENIRARFDVVAVNLTSHGPDIEVIKDAFELAY
ncbi:MAG: YraN family protein [Deltaproteobacteria bacterium]|nr:MAG: YraN family protein [Deltaproteobacteria bacterium]RLB80541.1 MAG: YraN family protein [Deltaproteobacteria bacterium]